jgi:uncharacterized protein YeaC (DUF1315 family)
MNNPMDYLQVIDSMSPEIYARLQRAVEQGKWPDGRVLTVEQRANAMQAIIAWGERHLAPDDRIGVIGKKPQAEALCDTTRETPLNWID